MGLDDVSTGRCLTCGLLAIWSNAYERGEHYWELEHERRKRGNVFHLVVVGGASSQTATPVCMKGCMQFKSEMSEKAWQHRKSAAGQSPELTEMAWSEAASVICKDRGCPDWTPYHPGIGPTKTLELKMFEDMTRRIEEDRRSWQAVLRVQDERREAMVQSAESAREKAQHKAMVRLTWVSIAVAAILGLGQILAALISR